MRLGIAQTGHGRRDGLARMRAGDTLVYYSAQERLGGPRNVRAFTAIGTLTDDDIWRAQEGDFRPWRRRVHYLSGARPVPIDALRHALDLTATSNWGVALRRGLVPLSDQDARRIHNAMMGVDDVRRDRTRE